MFGRARAGRVPEIGESGAAPGTSAPEPTPRLSLRANFTWVTAGQMTYALMQGVILVVLANLTTAATVGRFALALAIATPIVEFAHMRLRDVLATDAEGDYSLGEYASLTAINGSLSFFVIAAAALAFGYRDDVLTVILIVGLAKAVELASYVCYGAQQRAERMNRLGISLSLRGTLGAVGMTLGILLTDDLVWGVAAMAVAWIAILAFYDVPEARRAYPPDTTKPRASLGRLKTLALMALPLGVMQMLISLSPSIPRLFLERTAGAASLGIFAGMAYLVVGISTVARALAQTMAPRLGKHYTEGNMRGFLNVMKRQLQLASLMGAVGVIGAWFVGKPVLTLLYGAEYGEESGAFVALMVYAVTLFISMQLLQGLIAARWLRQQMLLSVVVVLVTLAAAAVLIGRFGIGGAVAVLIVSGGVRMAGSGMLLNWAVREART